MWGYVMLTRPTEFSYYASLAALFREFGYGARSFYYVVVDEQGIKTQVPTSASDLDKRIAGRFEPAVPFGVYGDNEVPLHVVIKTKRGSVMEFTAAYWHPTLKTFFAYFNYKGKMSRHESLDWIRAEIDKLPSSWRRRLAGLRAHLPV